MLSSMRIRGGALAVAAAVLAAGVGAPPASAASEGAIPIAGTFVYNGSNDTGNPVIHGAVNAVVRVPGGTAVFYSIGGPGANPSAVMPSVGLSTPYQAGAAWSVAVVDTKGLKLYLPLVSSDQKCLCSTVSDISDYGGTKTPRVGWAVLPELPAGLTSVTVQFGYGNLVVDVPVTDTLPAPTAGSSTVELGKGWPKLPDKATLQQADPAKSIRSLASNVADPTTSTKTTSDSTAISVDADVLFDYGKADLTAKAQGTLRKVAAQLSAKGDGQVSIVGYTDNTGSNSFNQDLSERRARSVQKALQQLVTKKGLSFTASGKGEQDPVADNSTAEGRQLNRRVTITFHTGGAR